MVQSIFNRTRAALLLAPARAEATTQSVAATCFRGARRLDARGFGAFALAATLMMVASPAFAQSGGGADPTSIVQAIVNIITGTLGKIIAVAAICIVGIGAMLGAFSARVAGGVILGVILIFSASWIVDQLLGGA